MKEFAGSEGKYRSIYDRTPVSLWEEDISMLRKRIKDLRDGGTTDLRAYIAAHPAFLLEAVQSIAVVDMNEATLRLYEAETKEQLIERLAATLPADAIGSFQGLILAIADGQRQFRMDLSALTLRGRKLSIVSLFSIPAEDDPFPSMLVSVFDVTERTRVEKENEQLKKRMEFILGATKTGLDIIDPQYRLHYVDPEWQKVYGDPSGRMCYEYFMGSKGPCSGCSLQKCFDAKALNVSEEILTGEENRPIQVTSVPFQDENGEWLVAEINVDIGERKRMEEKNLRLATLVDYSDDAIIGLDMDRKITIWNRGAERIYGYTVAEMIGSPISLLIPPDLEEEIRIIRERIARGESIGHFETVRRRKDGVLIDVSLSLFAISDTGGRILGLGSVARDITRQKEIEVQQRRIRRLENLATLSGGIAHQFNNINTVIKGYLDLLNREVKPQGQLAVFSQAASKGIQRAMDITDRLLELSDASSYRPQPVRLEEVARSQLPLFEARFSAQKAVRILELAESPPVHVDGKRLETVVSAFLSNALDSLADRPVREVTVRSGDVEGDAFLEVADTGCGIPPEDIDRLFTPFFTTKGEWAPPGSPQENWKGIGLSLAIGQATVSDYGGRIEVRSVPGVGSTFRIRLPAAKHPE